MQYLQTHKKILLWGLLAVVTFFTGWLLENQLAKRAVSEVYHQSFQKQFVKAETDFDSFFEQKLLEARLSNYQFSLQAAEFADLFDDEGYAFFVYRHDSLTFCSDNRIPVPEQWGDSFFSNSVLLFPNGWYYARWSSDGSKTLLAVMLIKHEYSIENQYISNFFSEKFELPSSVTISLLNFPGSEQIFNRSGESVFSLVFSGNEKIQPFRLTCIVLLYLLSLVLLLITITQWLGMQRKFDNKVYVLSGAFLLLMLIKYFMMHYGFPHIIYSLEVFQPQHFASSDFLPSLGDLMILTLFIFFIIYQVYVRLDFSFFNTLPPLKLNLLRVVFLIVFVAFYFVSIILYENLIINSNLSFQLHKIFNFNIYSFIGIIIVGIYFTILTLLGIKMLDIYKEQTSFHQFTVQFLGVLFTGFIGARLLYSHVDLLALAIFIFIVLTGFYICLVRKQKIQYPMIVGLILLFSAFSTYFISTTTLRKNIDEKKVLAITLASEHDPLAESLLIDLDNRLKNDTIIKTLLFDRYFNYHVVYDYVKRKYFSGYWDKYDFQLTRCYSSDSVMIEPDHVQFPCYPFFRRLLKLKGTRLQKSGFYYIDNNNGQISYFGKIQYLDYENYSDSHLYIELNQKLRTDALGYPELLIDKNLNRVVLAEEYSYAKYHRGQLIFQSGEYNYPLSFNFDNMPNEFNNYTAEGYEHLIYRESPGNVLILSRPRMQFYNFLVTFSYIFTFFFLLFNLGLFLSNLRRMGTLCHLNFRNKILFSYIGLLLLSLFLVGTVTLYYTFRQATSKNYETMSEKTQSVYTELSEYLLYEDSVSGDWAHFTGANLEEILRRLSNVFKTDLNFYDAQGRLVATSRPEIFNQHFINKRMHPEAYANLALQHKAEYVHSEKIGELDYLTAYVPFMNSRNKLLGYLNLPYFTRQNAIRQEIYNMMLTLINFYLLLILFSIVVAVLISKKITRPLSMLQRKFSEIRLGGGNQQIEYSGTDEIRDLIAEYNRMVQELERNVDLLARSERESAWREMARQIAHEIKNPLTPMKLSVQHLQRAWNDKVENWDEYLKRVSRTLIEQIDNLASIAGEFSNFAKMPNAQAEQIDLKQSLVNTLSLYAASDVSIEFIDDTNEPMTVIADREQLSRVFINLLNNALQAISPERAGEITVHLQRKQQIALVSVSDNGVGVSPGIGDRLFEPNFTTKSSGMGLGLAIVKNILMNTGGRIYYTNRETGGTIFTVELPLATKE